MKETQQAAQAAVQQPQSVVDNLMYEGRRFVEGATRNAQQTAESSRQTMGSMAKQVISPLPEDMYVACRCFAQCLLSLR